MTLEQLAALAKDANETNDPEHWLSFGDGKSFGLTDEDARYIAAASPNVVAALVAEVVAWRTCGAVPIPTKGHVGAISAARARTDAAMETRT